MNEKNDKNSVSSSDGIYKKPVLELVQNGKRWHPSMDNRGTGYFGGGGSDGGGEMDKRLTVLETHVSHMNAGISEIKTDFRDLKNRELILIFAAIGAFATVYGALAGVYFAIDEKLSNIDQRVANQSENITKQSIDLKTSIDKLIKTDVIQQNNK